PVLRIVATKGVRIVTGHISRPAYSKRRRRADIRHLAGRSEFVVVSLPAFLAFPFRGLTRACAGTDGPRGGPGARRAAHDTGGLRSLPDRGRSRLPPLDRIPLAQGA